MAGKPINAKIIKGGINKVEEMVRQEKDPKVKERLQAVLWRMQKVQPSEIARRLNREPNTISRWLTKWNKQGYEGLLDKTKPGRPTILSLDEQQKVIEIVENRKQGRITSKIISIKIKEKFNKEISKERVRVFLNKSGLSWKKPQKEDYRKDEEKRKNFISELEKKSI
ncbi:MAG: helix-turn-helix domain-containing protein [Nanoarchaeota archaeon]